MRFLLSQQKTVVHFEVEVGCGNMNTSKEIEKLWTIFNESYSHSNEIILVDKILQLLSFHESVRCQDITMYRRYLTLLNNGGFLIKEEKQFLINYFILLMSEIETPSSNLVISAQLRDCTSILDVWPEKQGIRVDYASGGTYRKEALLWFIRMYEALGNHFLHKRGHTIYYSNMELAAKLNDEKCRMSEDDYPLLGQFLEKSALFLKCEEEALLDIENSLKVMRKLIWKIKEGIIKYS